MSDALSYSALPSDEKGNGNNVDTNAASKTRRSAAWFVVLTVGAINWTFQGIASVLSVYFVDYLGFSTGTSGIFTNMALFFGYGFALVGGYVSDAWLGHFKTIRFGLVLVTIGVALMLYQALAYGEADGGAGGSNLLHRVVGEEEDGDVNLSAKRIFCFAGLGFYAVGNGIIRPSTSAFLGSQLNEDEGELRTLFYNWFYLLTQIGGSSAILMPIFLSDFGEKVFLWSMAGGTVVTLPLFVSGNWWYRHEEPAGSVLSEALSIIWQTRCCGSSSSAITSSNWSSSSSSSRVVEKEEENNGLVVQSSSSSSSVGVVVAAEQGEEDEENSPSGDTHEQKVTDVNTALSVLAIFLPLPFFWAVFFQMYSIWVFEAQDMDLEVLGYDVPSALVTSLNSIFDVLLIPFFAKLVYPCWKPSSLRKMGFGYVFTMLALLVALAVNWQVERNKGQVSVLWIIPQVLLISVAEILLSITCYDFAFAESPKSMTALLTSCFIATIALGNALVSVISAAELSRQSGQLLLLGIVFVCFIWYVSLAKNYVYRSAASVLV